MKSKALTLAVVAVVLAVGTYYGLNAVAPQKHHDEAVAASGPTVDEVFSGTLQLADDAPLAEVPTEDPALVPGPAPGEIAPEPGEEMPADEFADEVPAEESGADTVADEAIPTDLDDAASAEPKLEAEAPAPAAVEPPPAPAPAPAPAPKAEPKQPAASKPAPAAKPAAPAPVTNWWGNGDSPDKLALTYAGSAAYRTAVVLMFNRAFGSADSANSNIKVTDAAGKAVSGSWELNPNNAAMLVFPVQNTGRYTVSIKSGLTDLGKTTLGKNLKGPVTVK